MHGQKRHSVSEYGRQLNEKQKAQLIYGLTNTQMRNLFHNIESKEKLLRRLEQRLDHVVFLLGFAGSPRVARQLVSHGHILVNGRKTTIPSIFIKNGDVISIRNESKKSKMFSELSLKLKKYSSQLKRLP
jgi:small subunit ribosomal protein S4